MTRRTPAAPAGWDAPLEVVDLIPDELALARAQLASGLYGVAEGVLLRMIAGLEAAGKGELEELDGARALLAEALWRQGRSSSGGPGVCAVECTGSGVVGEAGGADAVVGAGRGCVSCQ